MNTFTRLSNRNLSYLISTEMLNKISTLPHRWIRVHCRTHDVYVGYREFPSFSFSFSLFFFLYWRFVLWTFDTSFLIIFLGLHYSQYLFTRYLLKILFSVLFNVWKIYINFHLLHICWNIKFHRMSIILLVFFNF